MAQISPVVIREHKTTGSHLKRTNFVNLTLSLDKYISYYDDSSNKLMVVDVDEPEDAIKVPCEGYRCIVNPLGGMVGVMNKDLKSLTIFDVDTNMLVKTQKLKEDLSFWRWISISTVAIITKKFVYHWNILDASAVPVKMFGRHTSLEGLNNKNINYVVDATGKWLLLAGTSQKKALQLYSVERGVTQMIDGYRASFCRLQVDGNLEYANLLCYVVEEGSATKLVIMEVGSSHLNRPFAKKVTKIELTEDDEGDLDTVVGLQTSFKFGLVFLLTLYGFIHLYDVETGQCIFTNSICKLTEPGEYFFDCAACEDEDGIIAVNMKGQVMTVKVTEKNLKPYLRNMKRNVSLAKSLEKRCDRAPAWHAAHGASRNGDLESEDTDVGYFLDPGGRPSAEEVEEGGIAAQMWNFMMRDRDENSDDFQPDPTSSQAKKKKKKKKKKTGGACAASAAPETVQNGVNGTSSASGASSAQAAQVSAKPSPKEPAGVPPPRPPPPPPNHEVEVQVKHKAPPSANTEEAPAASGNEEPKEEPAPGAAVPAVEGGEDDEGPDQAKECIMCYEREFNTVVTPCGHMWLCFECATEIKNNDQPCPACRGKVENIFRVFAKDG